MISEKVVSNIQILKPINKKTIKIMKQVTEIAASAYNQNFLTSCSLQHSNKTSQNRIFN